MVPIGLSVFPLLSDNREVIGPALRKGLRDAPGIVYPKVMG
jgi:hypothetical protein